ncbi:MAG: SPOR domain-containing protein [Bacteroidales bacterium]
MAMSPRDDYDRDILDIIPERFDADADSKQARAGHRLRSYLTLGVAVVAVGAIVATGLHFMGGKRAGGPGIPVIKADERPIKIRPDDRGGMQVPNQDKLVYERMEQGEGEGAGAPQVERLLPSPEQPQVPVKGAAVPDPQARPAGTEVLRPAQPVNTRPPAAVAEAPKPVVPPPVAPAPVQPVVQAPVQPAPLPATGGYVPTQARGGATPAPAPAAPPPPAAPAKIAAAPAPAPAPAPAAAPKPAAAPPAPAAAPVAAAAPVVAPKALAGGDWLIQLGALRTAPDADKEWGRIQRANHDLLATLKPDVVRVELGEKGTFWRLRAGPLSEQAAKQLCNELKARNQGCIIARK